MSPVIVTIICAFIGSAGLFSFITFLIQRRDGKHDNYTAMHDKHDEDVKMLREERDEMVAGIYEILNEIKEQTLKNERDNLRTQLLVLMSDYPDDTSEIMHCAEHYFKDLNGNWYATPLFVKYLKERGLVEPEWLLNK